MQGYRGERRRAAGARGQDPEVRLARQELLQPGENDPVVVRQHQRDRHQERPFTTVCPPSPLRPQAAA